MFPRLCPLQVLIDDNGDAEGNFSVVAALPDDGARVSMQPVGYFAYSHANDTQAALPVSNYCVAISQVSTHREFRYE